MYSIGNIAFKLLTAIAILTVIFSANPAISQSEAQDTSTGLQTDDAGQQDSDAATLRQHPVNASDPPEPMTQQEIDARRQELDRLIERAESTAAADNDQANRRARIRIRQIAVEADERGNQEFHDEAVDALFEAISANRVRVDDSEEDPSEPFGSDAPIGSSDPVVTFPDSEIGQTGQSTQVQNTGGASATGSLVGFAGDILGLDDQQTDLTSISENIADSVENIPELISSLAYLIALALGVWGILKIKDHVENPQQTRLSEGFTRLLAGGFLFALPTLYEAMRNTIGGADGFDNGDSTLITGISSIVGIISSYVPTQGANQVLGAIVTSFSGIPGLVSVAAYLIALILGIWGVLNVKDNIESGQNNPPLREGIGRILIGGALFALPTVFEATKNTLEGDGPGVFDFINEALGVGTMLNQAGECAEGGLGTVLCTTVLRTSAIPGFLTVTAYLLGIVLGLWAIFKLRDYVINPQQTQAWDFVSRFVAAGAFFALPTITRAIANSVGGILLIPHSTSGFNEPDAQGEEGLDNMIINLMDNAFGPATIVINWFGYVAGSILIFIGISRLLKSSQEGARGPGGFGTIMTFAVGGALISFSPMVTALSSSLFNLGGTQTTTYATLQSAHAAMSDDVRNHVLLVISAVTKFMIFVGLVSIMRGFFLVRDVAEGSQQASLMAATTHLIGGALAVNLGPLITAVQSTLGITELGIEFGSGGTDSGYIGNFLETAGS